MGSICPPMRSRSVRLQLVRNIPPAEHPAKTARSTFRIPAWALTLAVALGCGSDTSAPSIPAMPPGSAVVESPDGNGAVRPDPPGAADPVRPVGSNPVAIGGSNESEPTPVLQPGTGGTGSGGTGSG